MCKEKFIFCNKTKAPLTWHHLEYIGFEIEYRNINLLIVIAINTIKLLQHELEAYKQHFSNLLSSSYMLYGLQFTLYAIQLFLHNADDELNSF